ncbi:MAG: hypothetical protein EOM74_01560 [Methanomicrobia archaeon]|nr:hypothetical protein [Methanomicrobia archaeon]
MFPEQLKKILNLIKKTGDRVVLFDGANPDDTYVLMNLDSYSDLSGGAKQNQAVGSGKSIIAENQAQKEPEENLTEEDLTDKINREILMWKNREHEPYSAIDDRPKKAWSIPSQVKNKAQEVE